MSIIDLKINGVLKYEDEGYLVDTLVTRYYTKNIHIENGTLKGTINIASTVEMIEFIIWLLAIGIITMYTDQQCQTGNVTVIIANRFNEADENV